ncbi:hypothetical protein L345_08877, partial [Ophiophagus hannah]
MILCRAFFVRSRAAPIPCKDAACQDALHGAAVVGQKLDAEGWAGGDVKMGLGLLLDLETALSSSMVNSSTLLMRSSFPPRAKCEAKPSLRPAPSRPHMFRCRSWLPKERKKGRDTFSNAYFERKTQGRKNVREGRKGGWLDMGKGRKEGRKVG